MPRSWGGSRLRRSIRLDPPYYASIALAIGFGFLSALVVPGKDFPSVSWRHTAHLVYLQDILDLPAINPIYWTLCLEIQFYLIFCLLLGLAHRFRRDQTDRRSLYAIFLPAVLLAAAWPSGIARIQPLARSVLADLAWVSRRRARVLGVEWDDPRRVVLHLRDRACRGRGGDSKQFYGHLCHDFRAPLGSGARGKLRAVVDVGDLCNSWA